MRQLKRSIFFGALWALAASAFAVEIQGHARPIPAEEQIMVIEAAPPSETELEMPPPEPRVEVEEPIGHGIASWYGPGFHGRRTASGVRFDMEALTAAHRSLPFGTVVRVRSLVNGRSVDVLITDRGPFIKRRVIDLSRAAARALGLLESGTGIKPVVLSVIR